MNFLKFQKISLSDPSHWVIIKKTSKTTDESTLFVGCVLGPTLIEDLEGPKLREIFNFSDMLWVVIESTVSEKTAFYADWLDTLTLCLKKLLFMQTG